jgi:hypothetical protein
VFEIQPLNLIEHAWDILQRRISNRQNQPNSLQELADALVDEWSRIPQVEFLNTMVNKNFISNDSTIAYGTQRRSKTMTLNFRIFEKIPLLSKKLRSN